MEDTKKPQDKLVENIQVCENVARLLEVSAGQIDMAILDGAKAFQELSVLSTEIFKAISELKESLDDEAKAGSQSVLRVLEDKTNTALSYFQFFDLMNQRVDHSVHAVSQLSQYLRDKKIDVADECWADFRDSIASGYSLEQEKELFELMMEGVSRKEAVEHLQRKREQSKPLNVEFF